jgi:hypothetical protein
MKPKEIFRRPDAKKKKDTPLPFFFLICIISFYLKKCTMHPLIGSVEYFFSGKATTKAAVLSKEVTNPNPVLALFYKFYQCGVLKAQRNSGSIS